MNAMEKAAWAELLISLAAVAAAAALYPLMGTAATGCFGLLGLLGGTVWFARRRGRAVVVDERDQEIQRKATTFGILTAWIVTFMTLMLIIVRADHVDSATVPVTPLIWLLWTQFALCYAVKGLVALTIYRKQKRAA